MTSTNGLTSSRPLHITRITLRSTLHIMRRETGGTLAVGTLLLSCKVNQAGSEIYVGNKSEETILVRSAWCAQFSLGGKRPQDQDNGAQNSSSALSVTGFNASPARGGSCQTSV